MANAETLANALSEQLKSAVEELTVANDEVTAIVKADTLLETCRALHDEPSFRFEELIDLCAVDYSEYEGGNAGRPRFAVVYHLLSVSLNQRLRVKVFVEDGPMPRVPSVVDIWNCANWYEREAFDLYGLVFEGHPDLRRILTDYGFIGHPFRKDFPLSGNVEMRYDPEKKRVVYEPVTIDPRILVPKVIRHDNRYVRTPAKPASGTQQKSGA
jgi:NADH-quinone oxidoreductase subunit C